MKHSLSFRCIYLFIYFLHKYTLLNLFLHIICVFSTLYDVYHRNRGKTLFQHPNITPKNFSAMFTRTLGVLSALDAIRIA